MVVCVCAVCGVCVSMTLDEASEEDLIRDYFRNGHSYEVIRDFLETKHGMVMSLKTLKRRLKQLNLSRRASYTLMETVNSAIRTEPEWLRTAVGLQGYVADPATDAFVDHQTRPCYASTQIP